MCLFLQFKQMDKDQTGTIDWWEFLNHEALKKIATNRSKVSHLQFNCPVLCHCYHRHHHKQQRQSTP